MGRLSFVAFLTVSCGSHSDGGGTDDDAGGTNDTDPGGGGTIDACVETLYESFVGEELSSRHTRVYDSGGRLIEATLQSGYQPDTAEFTYTSLVVYSYGTGDLLVLAEADGPFGIDGVLDSETRYTYDAAGNLTRSEYEFFADATSNVTQTYTYDAAGNLVLDELDAGDDGEIDNSKSYTYNSAGDIATRVEVAGAYTYLWTYFYDALGQLTEITIDTGADGSFESAIFYTYDAAGNLLTEVTEEGGELERKSTWTYDASGKKATWLLEFSNSNLLPQFSTYTYDADGNIVLLEYDEGNDGDVDQHFEYTYDCPDA